MDFVDYLRKLTVRNLVVPSSGSAKIGNQHIITNQGTSYFVDSGHTNASDSNTGKSWSQCCATLDGAIGKCTANQGDIIYVAEGHSESWTTTGTKITGDIAGITIIGMGTGSDRPTFSFGHVGSTTSWTAANITIVNLLFLTAVDSVVTFGTISGADFKMINCESRDAAAKEVIDAWLVTTAAARFKVENYKHIGDIATGDASESIFNVTDVSDLEILNSKFITKCGTGVIEIPSTATNAIIDNCVFYVDGTSDLSLDVVDTDDDSTIVIRNCFDLEASSGFSGGNTGSGFSVAGDDVGAVSTAVASNLAAINGTTVTANGFLGTKVNKTAADILDGTQQAMFTISGGRVLVTHIELEVTTAAVDAGANNTQIVTDPTVGTDAPMCAVLDVDADEAGTIYSITGKPGDAMVGGSGGGAPGMEVSGFIVPEGAIDLLSAADGGTGGALIKAELWYIPLDSGASVASA